MPTLHIHLDPKTFELLAVRAVAECRPFTWQAEVLLRQALEEAVAPEQSHPEEVRCAAD